MNQKTLAFLVAAVLAVLCLFGSAPSQTHNLISFEKAEAFELFDQWREKHAKNYRED